MLLNNNKRCKQSDHITVSDGQKEDNIIRFTSIIALALRLSAFQLLDTYKVVQI
jgi:hypothetical protein